MYETTIQAASIKYGVPYTWIQAVIETESSWNPRAHPAGDGYGLMQLLEVTARNLGFTGDVTKLYEPTVNIDLGTKLLAENIRRFGGSFERVYSAYNSGNPDLYLTSSEVAANVARAVTALTKYTNLLVGMAVGSPMASIVAVLVGILVLSWVKRK